MSTIKIQNLNFTHEGAYAPLFENLCLQFDTGWKLGLIGRNGRGKTTLLDLIAGKYEYGGTITANTAFSRFPFPVRDPALPARAVFDETAPDAEEWEILRELSLLDVDEQALSRPFTQLSGGERTKLLLAALFLNDGGFLLIDEPTNHLDLEGRETVSAYLKRKKGFLLVSHDRAFLDGCVDHILAINKTDAELRSGNFSSWFEAFEKQQTAEAAQNERLKKDIARLSESAKRTSAWANRAEAAKNGGKLDSGLKPDKGYVSHKAAKMMKHAKTVKARQQEEIRQKSELLKNTETAEKLKFAPLTFRAEKLLSVRDLEIRYGPRTGCKPVTFEALRGERIALEGKNGCGKSSVLKLITGEDIPHLGTALLASGLTVSYVPQTASPCGRIADFARENAVDENLFRSILNKLGFTKKDFEGDIASYSEGQKKKILLAKSLCEQAHLYVWDEPLNYLDLYSRLQIERLLQDYRPTMIFVEHDRAFREAVATKTVFMP